MNPINRAKLAEIDERDRTVREDIRVHAMMVALGGMNRWELSKPGESRLEQIKELRQL